MAVFPLQWQKLKSAFAAADDDYLRGLADELNNGLDRCGLETRLRQAHFFAQVMQEAGANLQGRVESLSYSPEGLKATFKYYRDHPEEAIEDGYVRDPQTRKIVRPARQEAIANKVYCRPDLGNGDFSSGDGWRYRGRGLIQVTGKANYNTLNESYKKYYTDVCDVVSTPELLERFPYNVRSAVCFWNTHGLPKLADAGSTPAHVDAITAVVNKHTNSYKERRANFVRIFAALA